MAMLPRHDQPIVAIATAPGRGAVGIVRLSGADLSAFVTGLCGRSLAPRHATLLAFKSADGQPIDEGLALHFPAPHSYTGEDVLELQVHGGPVVLQLLLVRCLQLAAEPDAQGAQRLPGLRLAQPGEFTERAFLNDKLDLAQAEAVADLIDASTEAAARSARRALEGALSQPVQALAAELTELRALVEATLDFPEEEIDFLERADALGRVRRALARLDDILVRARQGVLLREGLKVVLAGQPNVGKSSLLNALAGAELAIVTPIAGTTRDRVGGTVQIEGVPVHVIDTAGLRDDDEATDEVERIGIARSWQAIEEADAVLLLHDLTRVGDAVYDTVDQSIERRLQAHGVIPLHLAHKADAAQRDTLPWPGALRLSSRTGDGLPALRRLLLERAGWQPAAEGVFTARERHLAALRDAQAHLQAALALLEEGAQALDLAAEELRRGHDALGLITGRVSADDLLGEIFGRFCIGK